MVTKKLVWSGFIGGVVYWLFVGWSISRNEWFSFTSNALSDLGGANATSPWIYNVGLVVTALFLFVFSLYLMSTVEGKLQLVGAAYISVSAIFLALIGIFHEGTRPHVFVSTYFFIQFFIGAVVYGLGSGGPIRLISAVLFGMALVGTILPWPSTALLETYEICLVIAFTVFVAVGGKGFTSQPQSNEGG